MVSVDLRKVNNAFNNSVVKTTVYGKLVAKLTNTETRGFVLKTKYDTDKAKLEKKVSDTSGLVKDTDCNAKISEIKGKIPSIKGSATSYALTAVENKIPDVISLVNKSLKLNRKLLIVIISNISLLHSFISLQKKFLMQD